MAENSKFDEKHESKIHPTTSSINPMRFTCRHITV